MSEHPLWHKDAIIYELHVKAFRDSNRDGVGDFRGLIEKLDYVQSLGVTTIWLLPFYPSPGRDDGYDISDYYSVAPQFGTVRDFKQLLKEAHRRGLKVLTELVINHTSDQHPWFQAARRAPQGSHEREFFVWSDTDKKFADTRIIFCDTEPSNWTWDPVAQQYYWHRFFSHQPDLNHNNPAVNKAVIDVMNYWFDMGVDGMRLDAIPYLCVREGTNNENLPETHAVLKEMRRQLDQRYRDRIFLAEANQWPLDVRPYFGDGDECHMAYHFPLMPRIFMALRREDNSPILDIMQRTPSIPDNCQWAIFLRNHDELTLEMVTDEERDYMYREYADDPRMRLNLGIRRRLAPLMDNSRRRMQILNSILLSFPGAPVIYYGDEIGMGDNIYLGDRNGVRTPMQWSIDRNGGFSDADTARLYQPLILDPVYGFQAVNVEAQERDRSSLLHFMRRLISLRRQYKAFGRGTFEFLPTSNRKVLAYLRKYKNEVILCVVNLSRFSQPVELDLRAYQGWVPMEMIGKAEFPRITDRPYFLSLGQHTFYWFTLEAESEPIQITLRGTEVDQDLPVLNVVGSLDAVFEPPLVQSLEMDILPNYLQRCRWYQGKSRQIVTVRVMDSAKMGAGFYWIIVEVKYDQGASDMYSLPLKLVIGSAATKMAAANPHGIVTRLKSDNDSGIIFDALLDQNSSRALLASMSDLRRFRSHREGEVRAIVPQNAVSWDLVQPSVRILDIEQTNTSVVFGDKAFLKIFRHVEEGPNPDLEINSFLVDRVTFVPRLYGGLEYRARNGDTYSLAMLQEFLPGRVDGWKYSTDQARKYFENPPLSFGADELHVNREGFLKIARSDLVDRIKESLGQYGNFVELLGQRTGQLHVALASDRRNRDFAPEKISSERIELQAARVLDAARQTLEGLGNRRAQFTPEVQSLVEDVLTNSAKLLDRAQGLRHSKGEVNVESSGMSAIRIHGDFHLGQVLVGENEISILDFEGEPLRTIVERRKKRLALKDVAGMLRSFSYCAYSVLAETERSGENSELLQLAQYWETAVSAVYLHSYEKQVEGQVFHPQDSAQVDILLDAQVIQKAFYELQYELSYRPDWVHVPLRGILRYLNES